MSTRTAKTGVVMVVLIALVGGVAGYQTYLRLQKTEEIREETLDNAIPRVAVVHPHAGPSEENFTLPGTVEAWYQAPIYAQVSGYVKMWHSDFGAHVKKGDLLAEINAPTLDADTAKAKADLKSAEAHYHLAAVTAKRWRAMRNSHAVSEQSITEQEANERSEAAALESAKQTVARFEALQKFKHIVAPFDGIVTARSINVGDYVNEGGGSMNSSGEATELFSVADTHQMRLFISVPETFSSILRPGLTADVVVPQFPNRHYQANFLTVAQGFDSNTRTVVTEFSLDNRDASLWPGSYATVKVTAPADSHILTIPSSALVFEEHGLEVAVLDASHHIQYKPVISGKILGEDVQITSGLAQDDWVVNNPPAALMDGELVEVVTPVNGYGTNSRAHAQAEPSHSEAKL